ncbi:MAG: methionyl-tRNA formyltransferase [Sedimenticola thiotaurini]|uniref:Methionyl-tRNA formyltransferase n=1 Tax=Sedimenticola thiotaurini TaxID=1543721 RepID=A0A558DAN0_9GAMM|nr:MAG: methionyl-tRNA formyltransferase [Sedimenticola thiotaurini]
MTNYIVASSKDWHRKAFARRQSGAADVWEYVSSPEELEWASEDYQPRYIFFLHWNWLVPKDIWSRYECVCFHMTDVPFGRGGSPLQNLIERGYSETQLTALRMSEEMDAGPVYVKRPLSLEGRAEEIYLRAGDISWELIDWIIRVKPEPVPQTGKVTLFKRRKPFQSVLPTNGELNRVYDHIRMLDAPTYPRAFVEHGDYILEFSQAEFGEEEVKAHVTIRKKQHDGKR